MYTELHPVSRYVCSALIAKSNILSRVSEPRAVSATVGQF